MNINIPKNIEDYLKKMFNSSDLTEMLEGVLIAWAEQHIRLNINSKKIDELISDEVILNEAKEITKFGSVKLRKSQKRVKIKKK